VTNSFLLGSDEAMEVITIALSRKQFEEVVRREQELLSGVEPK